jgi:hypothetical protein
MPKVSASTDLTACAMSEFDVTGQSGEFCGTVLHPTGCRKGPGRSPAGSANYRSSAVEACRPATSRSPHAARFRVTSYKFVASFLMVPVRAVDNSSSGQKRATPLSELMDCDQVRISFSIEPQRCNLRLEDAPGVASAGELGVTAPELCAYQKNVAVDWSGAQQLDATGARVLLSLADSKSTLTGIQDWFRIAGLSNTQGNSGRSA